jgi:hypothetical protein
MVSGHPRNRNGRTTFSVRFGGITWTESELPALQVESLLSTAAALCPGLSTTRLTALPDLVAGRPSGAPPCSSTTPGYPVNEQLTDEELPNRSVAN